MAFWTFYYADNGNVNNEIDFELFGDDPKSLYMLDNELGARVYTAPSLVL